MEAPQLDVAEAASESERQRLLERALQRLPPGQRRVVLLHHGHGIPLEEIAEQEGIATGTVKSRLHRGRARLAQILGGV